MALLEKLPSPDARVTRRWTLRALGAVSLIAFVSLWLQIHGLVGSTGILPFAPWLEHVARTSEAPYTSVPTLFWLWPTDVALHVACALGCGLSVLLVVGVPFEGFVLVGLWALYLSLSGVGQVFLGYQWDTLLLETLFIALLIARWTPWSPVQPSWFGMWALRLLLFKLMLGSGLVKLTSGDPSWWNGTALSVHYFTQPIPNPLSWAFHHLPDAWHALETWATLVIEIGLPFAIFAGRWGRAVAFVGFTLVLGMLFFTGNYGFFQLLSMVLVLSLLDDGWMVRPWMPAWVVRVPTPRPFQFPAWSGSMRELLHGSLLLAVVGISVPMQTGRIWDYQDLPESTLEGLRVVAPWRTVNAYGLFARMTQTRPELRIEGSMDGRTWTPYVFRYKPGPLDRSPPIVAPHMPRLDWQLWFAALRSCDRSPWVQNLMVRLADNEPAVVALIAHDPFPDGPRYIRAQRVVYEFSDTGPDWWRTTGAEQVYCRLFETE